MCTGDPLLRRQTLNIGRHAIHYPIRGYIFRCHKIRFQKIEILYFYTRKKCNFAN